MIELSDSSGNLFLLPEDLQWIDRDTWIPVEQSAEYSLEGALILEQSTKQAGRPITLQGAADMAWVSLATVDALAAALSHPERTWTLVLYGTTYSVYPRYQDGALESAPVIWIADPSGNDFRTITLRFFEV